MKLISVLQVSLVCSVNAIASIAVISTNIDFSSACGIQGPGQSPNNCTFSSTSSQATSTIKVTFYDSPSSGGTINHYSNGYVESFQCTVGQYSYLSVTAYPSSGYPFSYWSGISGATLQNSTGGTENAESSNPAQLTIYCASSINYADITADFIQLPEILHTFTYSSQGHLASSGPSPSFIVNNTNPSSFQFSASSDCGYETQSVNVTQNGELMYAWCIYVSTGQGNGRNYATVLWIENGSGYNPPGYPTGNTTVMLGLWLVNSAFANVTSFSANFVPSSGSPLYLGDVFVESYESTHVYDAVNDVSADIFQQAESYLGSGNFSLYQLGEAYWNIAEGVGGLEWFLQNASTCNTCLTHGFVNDFVPSLPLIVYSWQWSPGCVASLIAAAGVVADIFTDGGRLSLW